MSWIHARPSYAQKIILSTSWFLFILNNSWLNVIVIYPLRWITIHLCNFLNLCDSVYFRKFSLGEKHVLPQHRMLKHWWCNQNTTQALAILTSSIQNQPIRVDINRKGSHSTKYTTSYLSLDRKTTKTPTVQISNI